MPKPPTSTLMLVLKDEKTGGHLAVRLGAFVEFSKALDQDLERMVAQWSHLAAPRTRRASDMKLVRDRR